MNDAATKIADIMAHLVQSMYALVFPHVLSEALSMVRILLLDRVLS